MARVLIVDDDSDIRHLVAVRLRKAGHKVLDAGHLTKPFSGVALVNAVARAYPDDGAW